MGIENDMILPNDWVPENSIIKVIGVGGGGCNAVTYMYNERIQGCSFIVCNTDSQALQKSNVPVKIQLGEGLGAGTDPTGGRNAALESQDLIARTALDNGTKMLFITAGMGGGTGTGASPVIAKMARDRGILTVAVVTLPFSNEGNESLSKAIDGVRELEKSIKDVHEWRRYNMLHQVIRLGLAGKVQRRFMQKYRASVYRSVMRSGIGGMKQTDGVNVKCLHLQVASMIALGRHPGGEWLRTEGLCSDCGEEHSCCQFCSPRGREQHT